MAWMTIPVNMFILQTSNDHKTLIKDHQNPLHFYQSSPLIKRGFCPVCGSHILFANCKQPLYYEVCIGTVDLPLLTQPDLAPRNHIWTEAKLPWLHIDPHLPEYLQEPITTKTQITSKL